MSDSNTQQQQQPKQTTNDNPLDTMFNTDEKLLDNELLIFEQYKLYIEMADRISSRRAATNNFFLTANSFLFVALGVLISYRLLFLTPIMLIVGIFFCISWLLLIQYYKGINSCKFKVINEIEKRLPVMGFNTEWQLWIQKEKPNRMRGLTNIEIWIPISLLIMYAAGTVVILIILIFFYDQALSIIS